MTALKNRYPHLKVSLAIGGWNEGSTNYSIMASSPTSRQAFINSVSDFIRYLLLVLVISVSTFSVLREPLMYENTLYNSTLPPPPHTHTHTEKSGKMHIAWSMEIFQMHSLQFCILHLL
jgi:hypothetical protein